MDKICNISLSRMYSSPPVASVPSSIISHFFPYKRFTLNILAFEVVVVMVIVRTTRPFTPWSRALLEKLVCPYLSGNPMVHYHVHKSLHWTLS
jgi:hypothetical protein